MGDGGVIRGESVLLGKVVDVGRARRVADDLGVGVVLHYNQEDVVELRYRRRGDRRCGLDCDTASSHQHKGDRHHDGLHPASSGFLAREQNILGDAQYPIRHLAGQADARRRPACIRAWAQCVRGRSPH